MRKLALALAAAAALGFTAPVFTATDASAAQGRVQLARADVERASTDISSGRRHRHVKTVIVRRDAGWHRHHHRHYGWKHRHHGGKKVVVIKKHIYR